LWLIYPLSIWLKNIPSGLAKDNFIRYRPSLMSAFVQPEPVSSHLFPTHKCVINEWIKGTLNVTEPIQTQEEGKGLIPRFLLIDRIATRYIADMSKVTNSCWTSCAWGLNHFLKILIKRSLDKVSKVIPQRTSTSNQFNSVGRKDFPRG